MKRYIVISIIIFSVLLASGCKQMGDLTKPSQPKEPILGWTVDPKTLPPDLQLVLHALVTRMRGQENRETAVAFAPDAGPVVEKDFHYDDFFLRDVKVLEYLAGGSESDPRISLIMILGFEDLIGRRSAAMVQAIYGRNEKQLFVEQVRLFQIYPEIPQVRTILVPEAAFMMEKNRKFKSFYDLYFFALKHGVPLKTGQVKTTEDRYIILSFFTDRMAPDTLVVLALDDKPQGFGSAGEEASKSYDFLGWRVVILGLQHSLNAGETLYIKAMYKNKAHGEKLVGVYSTRSE